MEEATSLILNHESVDEPLVAFTFDDGFMECHSMIAPVLEQFGVNAAFFINPNFANGDDVYIQNFTNNIVLTPGKTPMRWKEIRDLHERGHIIGAIGQEIPPELYQAVAEILAMVYNMREK